jgi:hypothetical protein
MTKKRTKPKIINGSIKLDKDGDLIKLCIYKQTIIPIKIAYIISDKYIILYKYNGKYNPFFRFKKRNIFY